MESFNAKTKPIFDNPQKTIEKYEKMYQERHKNSNEESSCEE